MASDAVYDVLVQRLRGTHTYLLKVTQDLTDDQLSRSFGPTSPPIGWHLWHVARWADRLQASFAGNEDESGERPVLNRDIWNTDGLAAKWGLNTAALGLLEAGTGIDHGAAASLPGTVGKQELLEYARRAFSAADRALDHVPAEALGNSRRGIREFEIVDGVMRPAAAPQTTYVADLIFHIVHANRHLGMIEALRGLLDMNGSASG